MDGAAGPSDRSRSALPQALSPGRSGPASPATMSGTATVLQQFVSGLKSRSEETRAKAAKDLQHYVTTELREVRNLIPSSHTCAALGGMSADTLLY